jgi:hypothetical protein
MDPIPFERRPRPLPQTQNPDLYAAILRRLDALAEEIAAIEAFVIELADPEKTRVPTPDYPH